MSNPPNPLSQYHTYSYHHILLACDSTDTAEALQKSNELVTFRRDSTQVNTTTDPFGKYKPRTFQNVGKYSIVINGMEDSDLVIDKVKWSSVTAASAGSNGVDRFSTMTVEGEMYIEEPRGVKFMNIMAEVADKLGSDPNGIVFALKTIFIGHVSPSAAFTLNSNQASTINFARTNDIFDPITNVRAMLFFMYDITGEFTIQGGKYKIGFAGLNNGATKQKHIMRAAQQISVNFNGLTLADGLKKLQARINEQYDEYFEGIRKKVENTNAGAGRKLKFNGRKVTYIIEVEQPYGIVTRRTENGLPIYKGDSEYKIDDFAIQNTDKGKKDEAGTINFGDTLSVEQAIMKVVNHCSKIKEDAVYSENKEINKKTKWVPKVVSTIKSNSNEFKVIYKLRRVLEARSNVIGAVLNRTNDSTNNLTNDIERNLLTLDYFYTGKNTDILDFDIKMEMGLAFFQTLVTTETLPKETDAPKGKGPYQKESSLGVYSVKTKVDEKQGENNKEGHPPIRPRTPIFFSTKFNDRLTKNSKDPALSTKFQQLLNRHAALENLAAKVVIHGNPGLLNSNNKQPSEVSEHEDRTQTKSNVFSDPFPFWETTPAIVKLNIKMPSDREDTDFSLPFWYQGFYYCYAIEHLFESGTFTQALTMVSLPISNPKKDERADSKASNQEEETETNKVAANSDQSIGTQGKGASANESDTASGESGSKSPADANPENMRASDYLKIYFKDQIVPKC